MSDGKFVLPSFALKAGAKDCKFEIEINFDKRFCTKNTLRFFMTNIKIAKTFLNILSLNIFEI